MEMITLNDQIESKTLLKQENDQKNKKKHIKSFVAFFDRNINKFI